MFVKISDCHGTHDSPMSSIQVWSLVHVSLGKSILLLMATFLSIDTDVLNVFGEWPELCREASKAKTTCWVTKVKFLHSMKVSNSSHSFLFLRLSLLGSKSVQTWADNIFKSLMVSWLKSFWFFRRVELVRIQRMLFLFYMEPQFWWSGNRRIQWRRDHGKKQDVLEEG